MLTSILHFDLKSKQCGQHTDKADAKKLPCFICSCPFATYLSSSCCVLRITTMAVPSCLLLLQIMPQLLSFMSLDEEDPHAPDW